MSYLNNGAMIKLLKKAADTDSQKWGRQLATVCEQVAIQLRFKHGGTSLFTSTAPKRQRADEGVVEVDGEFYSV